MVSSCIISALHPPQSGRQVKHNSQARVDQDDRGRENRGSGQTSPSRVEGGDSGFYGVLLLRGNSGLAAFRAANAVSTRLT